MKISNSSTALEPSCPSQPASPKTSVDDLATKLSNWFDPHTRYVVALSGGVDSAVVTCAAKLNATQRIAVTGVGPSTSEQERQDARRIAQELEVQHVQIDAMEHLDPAYQRNGLDRCFHCKSHLFSAIKSRFPTWTILTGTNWDDLSDFRPGLQAARQAEVRSPLAELQITKVQVRQLAEHWGLHLADKPASPCLASRVAYGTEVTEERLRRIEAAEIVVKRLLGIRDCRVRLHADELARIELPMNELFRAMDSAMLSTIATELTKLGFRFVTLDLVGQRSGSLNPTQHDPNETQTALHQIWLPSDRS